MMLRTAVTAAVLINLAACASHRTASQVSAVVNDEAARQAARNTAAATADSKAALKAAEHAATSEAPAPR